MMAAALVLAVSLPVLGDGNTSGQVQFNRDIRPILVDNCYKCHGPDVKKRKAKLRFDLPDSVFAARDGITAVKPRDLKHSEVWALITSSDPEERMPPLKSNKTLTKDQIQLIKRWIEQGAQWENHWSFNAPKQAALPKVKKRAWITNAIDAIGGDGHIRIAAREQDDRVEISVSDDGGGVPEDLEEKIFQEFFTTRELGSGLGLAIARRIVEEHHGELALENKPGVGATFVIRLPRARIIDYEAGAVRGKGEKSREHA